MFGFAILFIIPTFSEVSSQCTHGDVRLVGGSVPNEGRVEVCVNSVWGTVCDDLWDSQDAMVVCGQLGYGRNGAVAYGQARFGQGTGPIVLDDVNCNSLTHRQLLDCPHPGLRIHNCFHSEDAGVRCSSFLVCTPGDVRLVGGSVPNEGRVEVCVFSEWGTVCDDGWDVQDATVVCVQLGYGRNGAVAYGSARFGQGTGSIVLDDVQCNSTNQRRLIDCPHPGLRIHNCLHSEDAGVRCSSLLPCTAGDVRLVGGTVPNEGRVEVCVNSVWGTVCDDDWDVQDAMVVCGQLGYAKSGAVAYSRAHFGRGTGSIVLDDVQCNSTAHRRLLDCPHPGLHLHNCDHSEDAGVSCPALPPCTHGDVRLVGGSVPNEGRVEVCVNSEWGTVCDDCWDDQDAMLVCGQLGYARTRATAYSFAHFGEGIGPIALDEVRCNPLLQIRLLDCPHSGLHIHDCSHLEDAGVSCCVESCNCTHGAVRLVGGSVPNEGRVEVCVNSEWGTVCDDLWDVQDAMVVCGQLGYAKNGARPFSSAHFGQGTGPIVLDNVQCNPSNHRQLLDCLHPGLYNDDCSHFEDAGVSCILNRVTGTLIATPWPVNVINTTYAATVSLTWEQTSEEGDRPSSFQAECKSQSRNSSLTLSVTDNRSFTTPIGGLLPSTSYNCCVSAVYDTMRTSGGVCTLVECVSAVYDTMRTSGGVCTLVETTSVVSTTTESQISSETESITTSFFPRDFTTTESKSSTTMPQTEFETTTTLNFIPASDEASVCTLNSTHPLVIGGVLGFVITVLLILLVIMCACVLRYRNMNKRHGLPLQSNVSYQVAASVVSIHRAETAEATPCALWDTNANKETTTKNNAGLKEPYYESAKCATLKGESDGIYSSVYELDGLDMHSYEGHYNVPRSGKSEDW